MTVTHQRHRLGLGTPTRPRLLLWASHRWGRCSTPALVIRRPTRIRWRQVGPG